MSPDCRTHLQNRLKPGMGIRKLAQDTIHMYIHSYTSTLIFFVVGLESTFLPYHFNFWNTFILNRVVIIIDTYFTESDGSTVA